MIEGLAVFLALLAVWTGVCLRIGRRWGERRLMARLDRIAADAPSDKSHVFIRHLAREIGVKPPDENL